MHVHLGAEHPLGQRLIEIAYQPAGIKYRLRVATRQQLVQKLRRKCLRVVLGHTSSSPSRALYGASHKNPDTPAEALVHRLLLLLAIGRTHQQERLGALRTGTDLGLDTLAHLAPVMRID